MKAALRREILAKRDAQDEPERLGKSGAIAKTLLALAEFEAAKTVLLYADFKSEVVTRAIVDGALKRGKRVVLPKVDKKARELLLFEIKDPDKELAPGHMGIPEPKAVPAVPGSQGHSGERPIEVAPDEIDLAVLPGVGFDESGNRLGYGGGYYDRLIENLKPSAALIGVAFELQVVGNIPSDSHDKKVDKIITETRAIDARR